MIAKVVIYKDTVGEWRLSAKAANGEQIVGSSEGYKNLSWAVNVAEQVFPFVPLVDEVGNQIPSQPIVPGAGRNLGAEIDQLVTAAKALVNTELEPHEAFADLRTALEPFE